MKYPFYTLFHKLFINSNILGKASPTWRTVDMTASANMSLQGVAIHSRVTIFGSEQAMIILLRFQ